jgi:nitrite reductase/ring-hydroxylating ferredoxin subunit
MSDMVRVADVQEIPPGTGKEFTVGERVIALFNVEGSFHALDGICRHAGGPLGQGALSGTVVTCPWHGWQFDVCTGRHCLTERIRQDVFRVEVRDGAVFIELDAPGQTDPA